MITEDYVSFETAKLLKEKGFDEKCRTFWKKWDGEIMLCPCCSGHVFEFCCNSMLEEYNDDSELNVAAPTLQMAMKWLREVHNIFIAINMIPDTIQKPYFFKPYVDKKIYNFPLDYSVEFYTTYEEACEAAIKYCIENLI